MSVETKPNYDLNMSKYKTAGQKNKEISDKRRRDALFKQWEAKLKKEGLGVISLSQEDKDIIQSSDNPISAARHYAENRAHDIDASYNWGHHNLFAQELKKRFNISLEEAHQIIENTIESIGKN